MLREFAAGLALGRRAARSAAAAGLVDPRSRRGIGGGRELPSVAIAADYASQVHGGADATALLDGRRLAAPGAALANGVLANVLDFDDGHRITKGHPGAMVIPAALAAAESRGATANEFLLACLIGYEVAIRAGIELHAREADYHASGAWGSLGAAVACARLSGWTPMRLGHAVDIAEYHAPIAHMSRAVTDPAMTKDACGWGAFIGMSAALLAEAGFTGLRSQGLRRVRRRVARASAGSCSSCTSSPTRAAAGRSRRSTRRSRLHARLG